ncbi:MAG: hypothetical protein ACI9LE_001675 [Paraglaciecola sp.]|jgi:hypothetical protein
MVRPTTFINGLATTQESQCKQTISVHLLSLKPSLIL